MGATWGESEKQRGRTYITGIITTLVQKRNGRGATLIQLLRGNTPRLLP